MVPVVRLGPTDYVTALEIQQRLHSRVANGELPAVLLLLNHPHVYTIGRRGNPEDIHLSPKKLTELGVEIHQAGRGGEVTYHGPGQIVAYPIINLKQLGIGPMLYIRGLEQILINTLAEFGIPAESEGHPTGVWAGGAKIAAIGVRVSRGVTTHGFALNVAPDLNYFDHIVPCGMPECRITSITAETGPVEIDKVTSSLIKHFRQHFGFKIKQSSLADVDSQTVVSATNI